MLIYLDDHLNVTSRDNAIFIRDNNLLYKIRQNATHMKAKFVLKGGKGSGFHGHAGGIGGPGNPGGSQSAGSGKGNNFGKKIMEININASNLAHSGKVRLNGLSVETANKILLAVQTAKIVGAPLPYSIHTGKFNDSALAKVTGAGELVINPNIDSLIADAEIARNDVMNAYNNNKLSDKLKERVDKILKYDSELVDNSIHGAVIHEMGHLLDNDNLSNPLRTIAMKDYQNKSLSYRGSVNAFEYFAESFVAYQNGRSIDTNTKIYFESVLSKPIIIYEFPTILKEMKENSISNNLDITKQAIFHIKPIIFKGGKGSGDFGHAGRPGLVGGSGEGGGKVRKPTLLDKVIPRYIQDYIVAGGKVAGKILTSSKDGFNTLILDSPDEVSIRGASGEYQGYWIANTGEIVADTNGNYHTRVMARAILDGLVDVNAKEKEIAWNTLTDQNIFESAETEDIGLSRNWIKVSVDNTRMDRTTLIFNELNHSIINRIKQYIDNGIIPKKKNITLVAKNTIKGYPAEGTFSLYEFMAANNVIPFGEGPSKLELKQVNSQILKEYKAIFHIKQKHIEGIP